MARVKMIIIVVVCIALLAVATSQFFLLQQPKEIPNTAGQSIQHQPLSRVNQFFNSPESFRTRQELQKSLNITPATWFGLVSSLAGAVLFWMSVMWISRRRRGF